MVRKLFNNIIFQIFIIFAVSLVFFFFFQFQIPDFLGRDAYYHIKMAKMAGGGRFVFNQFPWLYFTTLHQHFVDQHFLFHLLLAPFLVLGNFISPLIKGGIEEGFFGDFLGAKIATAFFSSLAILIFYFILRQNRVFGAFFWIILLLGVSSGFIFRMNLVQAQGLTMVWLFLGFLVLTRRKYVWLLFISFFYSWTHGGFILILVMVLVWVLITWFVKYCHSEGALATEKSRCLGNEIRGSFGRLWRPQNDSAWALVFTIFGLILGILLHPYFPELLSFLKTQLFQTGPFAQIPVGAEWYPYQTKNFLLGSGQVVLLFILAIAVLAICRISKKKPVLNEEHFIPIFTLFFLSLFFFVLTLRSQRFIEYFVPFCLLFCAFVLAPRLKVFASDLSGSHLNKFAFIKFFAAATLLAAVLFAWSFSIFMAKKSFIGSYYDDYQETALWLKNNTPKNSIIANLDWSDFPPLFYFDDQNYYISGLDQIFFYKYNKNLYQKYEDIINLKNLASASETLRKDFKTNYLVINNKFPKLEEKIKNNSQFFKVYGNEYLRIYKVKF